jgi:hypothetical protein
MIEDFLRIINYKISVWKCNFKYRVISTFYKKIGARLEINKVIKRLIKKGYNANDTLDIMSRYGRYKIYLGHKEHKESVKYLNQFIVEYSESTGIPQWEVREIFRKDFNIDI